MYTHGDKKFDEVYPACRALIGSDTWARIIDTCAETPKPEALQKILDQMGRRGLPEFLPELAHLEWAISKTSNGELMIPHEVEQIYVNPTVQLLQLSWKNLTPLLEKGEIAYPTLPEPGEELVLIWRDPKTRKIKTKVASKEDLLVLKITVEGIEPEKVAEESKLPVGAIDVAIDRAVKNGVLLAPKSKIRRDPTTFPVGERTDERFLVSTSFTLQWHITQVCDLHCKHCYDRSARSYMKLDQAIQILDDLRAFCRSRHVRGAVSFTGGNPVLYPHFLELYRAAAERGFAISILGNPTPRKQIQELAAIKKPSHFQVSLEGLPEHNDFIRGEGHFTRVIEFLKVLRDLKIYSMVMLTLTKDNLNQVLPLAEMLRNLTDKFHFNRLSMVGEGANLLLPDRDEYITFLESYTEAVKSNPIMGLKDNLINILRCKDGLKPFGGCTGYGCGAAFNFIAVLADGEAHACRKFPSPIGNVFHQSITDIYDSEMARRYRSGCSACQSCSIRPLCGGCLAIAYSHGLNVFEEKDPFCFINTS